MKDLWKQRAIELATCTHMKAADITESIENEFGLKNMYWRVYRCIRKARDRANEILSAKLDSEPEYIQPNFLDGNTIGWGDVSIPNKLVDKMVNDELLSISEKRIALQNQEPSPFDCSWDGKQTLKFAIMGDTQFGSRYTQITYLHNFYDICQEEGVASVFHTGDITDGLKMRPGHEYELYTIAADDMRDNVIKYYPRREGITTYFISGNHDASIYKHVGYDICASIAAARDDMVYLGRDCAVVNLTPNCKLELRHPWDGTAYAISYKIQKMIEAMESDSKPNILAVGHYHKAEYLFYRNVHAFQTGCFQSQTPFTRGKGISIHMGGWIIEAEVDETGTITRCKGEFIPFYKAITDDWKAYKD